LVVLDLMKSAAIRRAARRVPESTRRLSSSLTQNRPGVYAVTMSGLQNCSSSGF
jgi:hypothetical protein